jgi:hypothetical protein
MFQCISYYSWRCLKVSGLILRSLVYFEMVLVQGKKQRSSVSLLHVDIQFPQQHFLKRLSSALYVLRSFVEDQLAIVVWAYVRVSYSNSLVFISSFVPIPCCFYCYVSVVWFEVWYCDASNIGIFAQNCIVYLRSFVFSYIFQDWFSISVRNFIGILIGIA